MVGIRLDEDLRSVTEFRANAAAVIDQVKTTRRPVVLTQHGRGAVVLLDVREYQSMIDLLQTPARVETLSEPPSDPPTRDPAQAYKPDVDRTLLRENLALTAAQRISKLEEMARFAGELRSAPRRERP